MGGAGADPPTCKTGIGDIFSLSVPVFRKKNLPVAEIAQFFKKFPIFIYCVRITIILRVFKLIFSNSGGRMEIARLFI